MRLAGLLLVALACSCQPALQPYPNKDCTSACLRLAELGCIEGDPSPERGIPCESWCSQYHEIEYLRPWAPCVSQAGDVDAVRACGVRCE